MATNGSDKMISQQTIGQVSVVTEYQDEEQYFAKK